MKDREEYISILEQDNVELKKQVEDLFNENRNLRKKLENCMAFEDYKYTLNKKIKFETQQKEFIKYLEDEKNRLIKETSHYYIDSFDRQHAVNETIYDEVDIILQKYKEIIGDINDKK